VAFQNKAADCRKFPISSRAFLFGSVRQNERKIQNIKDVFQILRGGENLFLEIGI